MRCQILRTYFSDPALTTDVMVGFPGETEEDHQILMDFIDELEFDRLGVFAYSPEEDTPAATMEKQNEEEVKCERREELMELQQEIAYEKAEEMIGRELWCMVEGQVADEPSYVARTYKDAPDIDGLVFFSAEQELLSGDFVKVLVKEASDYDLIGELYYGNEFSE